MFYRQQNLQSQSLFIPPWTLALTVVILTRIMCSMVPVRGASSNWTTPEIWLQPTKIHYWETKKDFVSGNCKLVWLFSGEPTYPRNAFLNLKFELMLILYSIADNQNSIFLSCSIFLSIILVFELLVINFLIAINMMVIKYFLDDDKHNQQTWYIEVPHAARPPETDRYVKLGWSSPNTYTFN